MASQPASMTQTVCALCSPSTTLTARYAPRLVCQQEPNGCICNSRRCLLVAATNVFIVVGAAIDHDAFACAASATLLSITFLLLLSALDLLCRASACAGGKVKLSLPCLGCCSLAAAVRAWKQMAIMMLLLLCSLTLSTSTVHLDRHFLLQISNSRLCSLQLIMRSTPFASRPRNLCGLSTCEE